MTSCETHCRGVDKRADLITMISKMQLNRGPGRYGRLDEFDRRERMISGAGGSYYIPSHSLARILVPASVFDGCTIIIARLDGGGGDGLNDDG